MLDSVNLQKVLVKEEYKPMAAKLKQQLSVLQQSVKQNALPVVVLFEGWSAAGKGSKIGDIILNLDPRGFKVYSTVSPTEEEKRYPYLWRFWSKTPRQGDISIFDRSWYQGVSVEKIEQQLDSETVAARIKSILTFERQLVDDGCLVLKFFLHISKKEQKKRLEDLREQKSTRWRATDRDWYQNKHYEDYYRVFDEMLEATSTSYAPWHAIGCNDRNAALAEIYQILIKQITAAIAKKQALQKDPPPVGPIAIDPKFRLVQVPRLEEVDLDKTIDPDKYKVVLKEEQRKLKKLHNQLQPALRQKAPGSGGVRGVGRRRQRRQHPPGGRRSRPPRVRGGPHRRPRQDRALPPLSVAVLDPATQRRARGHLRPQLVRPADGRAGRGLLHPGRLAPRL